MKLAGTNPADTSLCRHLLCTLAYRLTHTLDGAPADFASFSLGYGVRTPQQLVRHMNGVLYYGLAALQPAETTRHAPPELSWEGKVARFYEVLELLGAELSCKPPSSELLARLVQGPLTDVITHIGQLALRRRAAGSPVAPENFFRAEVGPLE